MRRRLMLLAFIVATLGGAFASPATASQCEGVDCATAPVYAAVCTASHAKDYKHLGQHIADCFTQLT